MIDPGTTPVYKYINDLHTASDKFNYILYADDTTLFGNISNFKSVNMRAVLPTI